MAVAYVEETGSKRCARYDLIQIQTEQEKIVCSKCGLLLTEAHFWGKKGGNGPRMYVRTRWCVGCRHEKRRSKGWEPGIDPALMTPQQKQYELAKALAASRNTQGTESYRAEDGQRRCSRCNSTLYRELVLLNHEAGHPFGYIIQWRCWAAGHEALERWRLGSPMKGRFPTSDIATTEWAESPKKKEPPKLVALTTYDAERATKVMKPILTFESRPGRTRNMLIKRLDADLVEGCDVRCELLRYRDADDDNSPIYVRRIHHPEAHNGYVQDGPGRLTELSWAGMVADFEEFTLRIDGRQVSTGLTAREWSILRALAKEFGKVVTQDQILHTAWGDGYTNEPHLLRVNMARLRKKMDSNDSSRFIKTVARVGYRLGNMEALRKINEAGTEQKQAVMV